MAYCTADNVRAIANISTSTMSDSQINALITYATAFLNKDVNGIVREELVDYIDDNRDNTIDGSNTEFYVQRSYLWYFGDYDNDGDVDTSDVIVYEYDEDDNKNTLTVSSIDENGKITLSSAPAETSTLRITYAYAPVSEQTPDPLITLACSQLAASMCFTKINATDWNRISLGKLTVVRGRFDKPFYEYKAQYDETLKLLKSRIQRKMILETSGMKDVITERLKWII